MKALERYYVHEQKKHNLSYMLFFHSIPWKILFVHKQKNKIKKFIMNVFFLMES
jgi:hypothetical protein